MSTAAAIAIVVGIVALCVCVGVLLGFFKPLPDEDEHDPHEGGSS